jgi:hypothetical protein
MPWLTISGSAVPVSSRSSSDLISGNSAGLMVGIDWDITTAPSAESPPRLTWTGEFPLKALE